MSLGDEMCNANQIHNHWLFTRHYKFVQTLDEATLVWIFTKFSSYLAINTPQRYNRWPNTKFLKPTVTKRQLNVVERATVKCTGTKISQSAFWSYEYPKYWERLNKNGKKFDSVVRLVTLKGTVVSKRKRQRLVSNLALS